MRPSITETKAVIVAENLHNVATALEARDMLPELVERLRLAATTIVELLQELRTLRKEGTHGAP